MPFHKISTPTGATAPVQKVKEISSTDSTTKICFFFRTSLDVKQGHPLERCPQGCRPWRGRGPGSPVGGATFRRFEELDKTTPSVNGGSADIGHQGTGLFSGGFFQHFAKNSIYKRVIHLVRTQAGGGLAQRVRCKGQFIITMTSYCVLRVGGVKMPKYCVHTKLMTPYPNHPRLWP